MKRILILFFISAFAIGCESQDVFLKHDYQLYNLSEVNLITWDGLKCDGQVQQNTVRIELKEPDRNGETCINLLFVNESKARSWVIDAWRKLDEKGLAIFPQ